MKAIILSGSNSRNSGGLFNSARKLGLTLLKNHPVEMEFLMHDDEYSEMDRPFYLPARPVSYQIKGPGNLGFSPDVYEKISGLAPDIVHVQTLWMYLSYANLKYHRATHTPYIIAPRGMLDKWSVNRSRLKKKISLALYERAHLNNAACMHALCRSEMDSMRTFGLTNPIAVIPNGVDIPDPGRDYSLLERPWKPREGKKVLLFLSRIHVKKGIENLLQAWASKKSTGHDWILAIAGETRDTAYFNSLQALTDRLGISDTVSFIGGQFGEGKTAALSGADAFILPSFSEGLPMAVLEAWSFGLPVLITPECNIPEGYASGAAIRIEADTDSITAGLTRLFDLPEEERKAIGARGYSLVRERFTWDQVAASTYALYSWVQGEGPQPSFIHQ